MAPPPPQTAPPQQQLRLQEEPSAVPATATTTGGPPVRSDLKRVYVTGFGTFKDIAVNPSYLIASTLPATLPSKYLRTEKKKQKPHHPHAHHHHIQYEECDPFTVSLECYPTPVDVTYSYVDKLQTNLPNDVDLTIHIGVAASYDHVTIETRARSAVYKQPDFSGEHLINGGRAVEPPQCERDEEEDCCILYTDVDVDAAVNRCGNFSGTPGFENMEKPDVSREAGLYLCEYIYYSSLKRMIWGEVDNNNDCGKNNEEEEDEKKKKKKKRWSSDRAVFIHVPNCTDDESIEKYRSTIMMVIAAIMLSKYGKEEEGHHQSLVHQEGVEFPMEMKEEEEAGYVVVNRRGY